MVSKGFGMIGQKNILYITILALTCICNDGRAILPLLRGHLACHKTQ
jgi:hypothetical protein